MKITALCHSGLGGSYILKINTELVLREIGITDFEVSHCALLSANQTNTDFFILAKDISESAKSLKNLIIVNNVIDLKNIRQKLEEALRKNGML